MATERQIVLKVLSGPQLGAEAVLTEGEYTLGSGDSCDLSITDVLIAPKHIRIEIESHATYITPLATPTYYNGKPMEDNNRVTWNAYDFVSVGSTHLVIGSPSASWPPLKAPALPQLEGAIARNKTPNTPFGRALRDPILGGIAIVTLLIMLLMSTLLVYWYFSPEPASVRISQLEGDVKDQLATLPYPHREKFHPTHNRLYVTVFVDSDNHQAELQSQFQQLDPRVETLIHSQESLLKSIREVVETPARNIEVASNGLAKINISGYVGDQKEWEDDIKRLKSDLPHIEEIALDTTYTKEDILSYANSVINDSSIIGQLTPTLEELELLLDGIIIQESANEWEDSISQFNQKLGPYLSITNRVQVIPEDEAFRIEKEIFDKPMQIVRSGKNGWVAMPDGLKYFTGAVLENGWEIISIEDNYLQLRKKNRTIKVPLNYPVITNDS